MKNGRMTGYQAMEYILASAWSGGQAGNVATPQEAARVLFLPLTAPLALIRNVSQAVSKGGEVLSGRERPKWGPEPTLEARPVKVGKNAHGFMDFPITHEVGIRRPRPGERTKSVGVNNDGYNSRGGNARERMALTKGGELYGGPHEATGQTTIKTSIF